MKLLADVGVSVSTTAMRRERGHDASHLREEGLQRLADEDILIKARQEPRCILTFDLDFTDLHALNLADWPSVIIFRLRDQTPLSVNRHLIHQ